MRSLSGLVLLAGIGVGVFVYLPAPVDSRTALDNVTRKSEMHPSARHATGVLTTAKTLRTFSPNVPLVMPQQKPKALASRERVPVATRNGTAPSARIETVALTSTQQPAIGNWKTVARSAPGVPATRVTLNSLRPKDAASRYKLIVALQRELKQAGCYFGRIDGSWGSGSKYAMGEFTTRINAALPVDDPDYVLLSLLNANKGRRCDRCPDGQTLASNGRCMPNAIITQEARQPQQVARSSDETLPWQNKLAAVPPPRPAVRRPLTPVGTSVISNSNRALPGRMAIGGPKPFAADGLSEPMITGPAGPETRSAALSEERNSWNSAPVASPRAAKKKTTKRASTKKRRRGRVSRGTPNYYMMQTLGGLY